jgi:hypothetical protein
LRSTAAIKRLSAAFPATKAGPRDPPLSAVSRLLKSSPDIDIAAEWHCAQFAVRISIALAPESDAHPAEAIRPASKLLRNNLELPRFVEIYNRNCKHSNLRFTLDSPWVQGA